MRSICLGHLPEQMEFPNRVHPSKVRSVLCVWLIQREMHNSSAADCKFYSFTHVYVHCCHVGLLSWVWWELSG